MTKKPKKSAGEEEGDDRKTVQIQGETHARLRRYCGRAIKVQTVVDSAMRWMLENDAVLLDAVVNRERIGSDRVRDMYCTALRALAVEVCAGTSSRLKDLSVNQR